jgi:hypothetical protein
MEQPVSFVIRVINHGENQSMYGQIEHVSTGTTAHFSSLDQADAFIRSHLTPEAASLQIPPLTTDVRPEMSSIFSFMRGRQALGGTEPALLPPVAELPTIEVVSPVMPEVVPDAPSTAGEAPLALTTTEQPVTSVLILPASASTAAPLAIEMSVAETMITPVDRAIAALLSILDDYLPPLALPLPAASLSIASLTEQAVGLGNFRGLETRGAFTTAALKGIQLNALVRFQLWAVGPAQVEQAATDLNARLMADRQSLLHIALPDATSASLLRLGLEATTPVEYLAQLDGWRKQVDYRVLFEYRYQDSDGAESLIARIPIHADPEILGSPDRETTVVTDEMIRWDEQAASTLVIRGRTRIGSLSLLVFVPGMAPSGTVTLTRTFEGAPTPPTVFTTLTDFLAAVTDPAANRNAQIAFASFSDFVDAFSVAGDDVGLGDWNMDSVPDRYQAKQLSFASPIVLPTANDRFEISYGNSALEQVGVLYLRARRGA